MFYILILLSGIFNNLPFLGDISPDVTFDSQEECTVFLEESKHKEDLSTLLNKLKDKGFKDIVVLDTKCLPNGERVP